PVWAPTPLAAYVRNGARFATVSATAASWWTPAERSAHALAVPAGVALVDNPDSYLLTDTALVAGTSDGRLVVWALPGGEVRTFEGGHAAVSELFASRDGTTLVS